MNRCFLVLFFSLTIFQLQAQVKSGSVIGIVHTAKGEALHNATISIQKKAVTMTDSTGKFVVDNITTGRQEVVITAAGYSAKTVTVHIQESKEAEINVTMEADGFMNEVVVTAGRKVESIKEVPSSVTILQAKQIREQLSINPNMTSILGNTVPGLGTSTNKATNAGQTLRGRAVLVLIDGIPQSTPLMNGSRDMRTIDPAVIERVEVIKGATSIYGNGSGGGIINFITKKPEDGKAVSGETNISGNGNLTQWGNTLGYRLSQTLHGNIKKFSYVVSGVYEENGVQKDAKGVVIAQPDGLGETKNYNLFGKLSYQFTDNQEVTVSYNLFRSRQYADYINVTGKYNEFPAYGVEGIDPGQAAGTPHNHNLYVSYRAGKLPFNTSLELVAYDHHFQSLNRYVEKGTAWYGPGQTYIESWKQGVRLNLNTPWKWKMFSGDVTYGLDVLKDRTNQTLTDGRVYIPDMNMLNYAPFAQVKIDINDFVIKGGVRYENANIKVRDFNTLSKNADGSGTNFVKGGTLHPNATMFNAGLRYTRFDFFNPFVSFGQAFGLNELGRVLRSATQSSLDQIVTDPVIINNYEAGFSSQLGPVSLTAAYFINTSKLGANLVMVNGMFVTKREPEKVEGYEATAEVQIMKGLRAGGTVSYVEGKSENTDSTKVYLSSERIMPLKATGFISYSPIAALNLQLSTIHTGSRNRFAPKNGVYNGGEAPVKPVTYFNFNGGYKINQSFNVALGIENLFNQSYFPPRSQYRVLDAEYVRGTGAHFTLSLGYKF